MLPLFTGLRTKRSLIPPHQDCPSERESLHLSGAWLWKEVWPEARVAGSYAFCSQGAQVGVPEGRVQCYICLGPHPLQAYERGSLKTFSMIFNYAQTHCSTPSPIIEGVLNTEWTCVTVYNDQVIIIDHVPELEILNMSLAFWLFNHP